MHGDRIMPLREFVASLADARILVLDVRPPDERAVLPLENRFFAVIYAPRADLPKTLPAVATLVGQRHVVVVDDEEARARDAADLLRSIEVDADALEDGIAGWMWALDDCKTRVPAVP
jgi:rhodanese-related sulfurtransferase